ncbi:MAG: hypothetical protein QOF55_318, partial [Thermoleophilaceae bacterium]|nr:hypothetical protein [Thermoleophilaceae bacterium]
MRLGPVSAAVCACLAAWAPAAWAGFVPALPVDGPSADVLPGPDVALARDGSGALAYMKAEGGVAHVFFASLDRGVPQPPQRVDAGQSQASSQGRIAVASGGRAVVTWVNGGQLYAALRAPGATAFAPPVLVYGDPAVTVQDVPTSLAMTINGKAYAAFVTSGGDLRAAYMAVDGTWALADQPLDLDQSRTAAAPAVAASGDGTALYAWTETGGDGVSHVVARRMIRTRLGTVPRELSVGSLEGRSGGSADSPSPGIEYDSSYAWIAFRQDFDDGGAVSSRILARRLVGSELDPPVPVDGLSFPAGAGAERPRLAFTGRGRGTVAASLRGTPGIVGDLLKNDVFQPPVRLDAGPEAAAAFPVPTAADDSSGTVSWRRDPGPGGVPAIVGRHFTPLLADPEVMLSSPDFGPVDAGGGGGGGGGLEASADRAGNAAIAFTQGDATGRRVVVALYDLAPRAP